MWPRDRRETASLTTSNRERVRPSSCSTARAWSPDRSACADAGGERRQRLQLGLGGRRVGRIEQLERRRTRAARARAVATLDSATGSVGSARSRAAAWRRRRSLRRRARRRAAARRTRRRASRAGRASPRRRGARGSRPAHRSRRRPREAPARAVRCASQPAASASPASSSQASRRKSASGVRAGCERAHRKPDLRRRDRGERRIASPNGSRRTTSTAPTSRSPANAGTREDRGARPLGDPQHGPGREGRRRAGPAPARVPATSAASADVSGATERATRSPSSPTNPDRDELRAERLGRAGGDRGERRPQLTPRRDLFGRVGKRLDRRPLGSDGHPEGREYCLIQSRGWPSQPARRPTELDDAPSLDPLAIERNYRRERARRRARIEHKSRARRSDVRFYVTLLVLVVRDRVRDPRGVARGADALRRLVESAAGGRVSRSRSHVVPLHIGHCGSVDCTVTP